MRGQTNQQQLEAKFMKTDFKPFSKLVSAIRRLALLRYNNLTWYLTILDNEKA